MKVRVNWDDVVFFFFKGVRRMQKWMRKEEKWKEEVRERAGVDEGRKCELCNSF